jgi:hypothetical protein
MTAEARNSLADELLATIEDLQSALLRATEAGRRLGELAPRVESLAETFAELEALIASGRQRNVGGAGAAPTATFTRPTLVVPPSPRTAPVTESELVSVRLAFTSNGGPLDLRAVDDAVNAHAAVRDVALLDYDGTCATLRIWIPAEAEPADIRRGLAESWTELFGGQTRDVTIAVLDDVA